MSVFWRPRGCVLWFDFAELSGDTVYDLSGNGNHGTIYNCEWRRGHLVGSLYFNGTNAYIRVPHSDSLDFDYLTIELFVKPDVGDVQRYGIMRGDSSIVVWSISFRGDLGNGVVEFHIETTDGGKSLYVSDVAPDGVWAHVVYTYDGSQMKCYSNGVFKKSDSWSGTLVKGAYDVYIGSYIASSMFWRGINAHLRIYNRALSEREIRAHANYLLQKYIAHPPFI